MTTEDPVFVTQKGKLSKKFEEDYVLEPEESIATLLLKKSQESSNLQDQLKQTRVQYFQRIKRCEEKEEELKKRKAEFEQHKLKFERFMKDNEQKRLKATTKAHEEIKERENLETEMEGYLKEIERLKQKKKDVEGQLRDLKQYHRFLESVVLADERFESVNDVLVRQKTLQNIKKKQMQKIEKRDRTIETMKHELSKLIKEKQNEILVLTGVLSESKQSYENVQLERVTKEQELFETEETNTSKIGELGEAKLAISNLYARSKLKWNKDKLPLTEKLETIGNLLVDLRGIIGDFYKQQSKEEKKMNSKGL